MQHDEDWRVIRHDVRCMSEIERIDVFEVGQPQRLIENGSFAVVEWIGKGQRARRKPEEPRSGCGIGNQEQADANPLPRGAVRSKQPPDERAIEHHLYLSIALKFNSTPRLRESPECGSRRWGVNPSEDCAKKKKKK